MKDETNGPLAGLLFLLSLASCILSLARIFHRADTG